MTIKRKTLSLTKPDIRETIGLKETSNSAKIEWDTEFIMNLHAEDHKIIEQVVKSAGNPELEQSLLEQYKERVYIASHERFTPGHGRTIYINLKQPVLIKGKLITVIRLKGVRPRITDQNGLTVYQPKEDLSRTIAPNSAGEIEVKKGIPEPSGTNKQDETELEHMVMSQGQNRGFQVDHSVGRGQFPNLSFNGNPVSFNIIGMTSEDIRLNTVDNYLNGYLSEINYHTGKSVTYDFTTASKIAFEIGRTFRAFHDSGFFHMFPHMGNLGITFDDENRPIITIRDLTDVVKREALGDDLNNRKMREVNLRFIDLMKILNPLIIEKKARFDPDMDDYLYENAWPLINEILKGYFGDDINKLSSQIGYQRPAINDWFRSAQIGDTFNLMEHEKGWPLLVQAISDIVEP